MAQTTLTTAIRPKLCIMVPSTFFAAHQAAVEQRQAGTGHHQNQSRADQHPGVVARALGGLDRSFQVADASLGGASVNTQNRPYMIT